MNIEQLTISEARQIAAMFQTRSTSESHWRIGSNYFIRTVTHHHTGKLVAITEHEIVFEFTEALASCKFNEVEMFPARSKVIIGRGSLIDAVEISSIPTSEK